jgi:hypothetical protein
MNKPERSTFTPLDFGEWHTLGTLQLQPKFQRREVWSTAKRCYLIDTLLSGMPVPPIFMRITQSNDRKRMIREIVDGQQRVKAVLDFIDGKYNLSKLYSEKYNANRFDKLSIAHQDTIRQYSFICEIFQGISDAEVLEIFARVNTYSVPLNQQELLNGKYFGFFKTLAYSLAYEHLEFWRRNRIFSEISIARMSEVELTGELMCFLIAGTQHKKDSLETFYSANDDIFPHFAKVERRFRVVVDAITEIFEDELSSSEFHRPAFFYTLFSVVSDRLFQPIESSNARKTVAISASERSKAKDRLLQISNDISLIKEGKAPKGYSNDFVNACIKSTDKLNERQVRLNTIYKRVFS